MKLSIIMPSYNEAATIAILLDRITALDLGAIEKEIIVVDGQSTDGTKKVLERYAAVGSLQVIHETERRGKGRAMRTGLAHATGEIVIFQDADLELDPREYPTLLQPIVERQAQVVFGSRFLLTSFKGSRMNRFGNWLVTTLVNLLYRAHLTDVETGYKVFRRSVLMKLDLACDRFDIEPEITIKILERNIRIHEIPINYTPRTIAEGKKIRWTAGFDALRIIFTLRCVSALPFLKPLLGMSRPGFRQRQVPEPLDGQQSLSKSKAGEEPLQDQDMEYEDALL